MPGSPGNSDAHRGLDTAVVESLAYLERVDHPAARGFRARLASALKSLRFDLLRSPGTPGYDLLGRAERDALTATIADMVALFERCESQYVARSTADDYQWAYRAAIGARQVDNWLRRVPVGWKPSSDGMVFPSQRNSFLVVATDVRDRAQADNLDWIVNRESPNGKILIYASRYHLSKMPIETAWWKREQQVAGTYLKRRYDSRLLTIGNLIGREEGTCSNSSKPVNPRERLASVDSLAAQLGVPLFILDQRNAPDEVASWLNEKRTLGQGEGVFELSLGRAFDLLLYIDTVNIMC